MEPKQQQPQQPVMPQQPVRPVQPVQQQPMQQTPVSANPAVSSAPTSDFLSRMDAVNHPTPAEPAKKGPSKGLIIGIVVAVVAVIGVVAALFMMNSNKTTTPTPTVTTTYDDDEPEEPEISEEILERNKLREKDLVPLAEAVKLYQAEKESEGQLPGSDNKEWLGVIARYVPGGEIKDGATGETYTMGSVCRFGDTCVDISSLTWEENKHKIYVLYNADCKGKTKENVIVSSTRKRHAAIFAIVEGDQFICTTN